MNEYRYMVLSTGFIKNIDGRDIDFSILVDCEGKVIIKPTIPTQVQRHFPSGLVMKIEEDELIIYPNN